MVKITEDMHQDIMNLYDNNISVQDIANAYNVCKDTIYSVIRKYRKQRTYKTLSEDEQLNIVYLYKNGMSTVELGKMYNFNHHVIEHILDLHNIPRRNNSECHRTYTIKEDYFDKVDDQNKAYILGFFYADGCNSMSKNTIHMSLQEDDFEILEKIRIEIGSNRELEYIDNTKKSVKDGFNYKNQYRLAVFNKHWCDRLSELGMVSAKSLVIQFPYFLDESLYPHFIRGVMDGDGCIYKQDKVYVVTITSTKQFCEKLQKIVYQELGIPSKLEEASNKNGITYVWKINRKADNKKFLDWLYEDAEMYMKRKHDIYLNKYCV